jgi:hydrogenase maturation protease
MKYIIAIGNMMRSDDGVGAHIVEYIINNELEDGFQALDFASNAWAMLPLLNTQTDKILIIDCVLMHEKAGTAKIFSLDCIIEQDILSTESHQCSIMQLLKLAKKADYYIPAISIMGIEANTMEYGLSLSALIKDNLIDYSQQAILFIQNTN